MGAPTIKQLANRINSCARLSGEFTLRSGRTSNTYFDKYQFESDPVLLRDICEAMVPLLPERVEVLCGLELGGVPVVSVLSQLTGLPAAFLRKTAKTYGTCKYAEGADLAGKPIVLIEDVVSSGGAIIDSTKMLRADGFDVDCALCVIDRETGGREALLEQGIELRSVLRMSDLDAV